MQFEIYQWLVPLISLFYIYRTILGVIRKRRSVPTAIVWIIFWTTLIILALIPDPFSVAIQKTLGFKSNVTALIFVALGLLFLFVFYLSTMIETLERRLTELVRRLAIEEEVNKRLMAAQKTEPILKEKLHDKPKVLKKGEK